MRFHAFHEDVLGSREKVRLLTLFLKFPRKIFTANEAAGLTGITGTGAWRIAKQFESQGLLFRQRIGHSDAWQLREGHFLAKNLQALTADPWQVLRKKLEQKLKGVGLVKIVLFGSMARKEERPDSDVDLLVVIKSKKDKEKASRQLLDLTVELLDLYGNRLSPVIFSEKELLEKTDSGMELIKETKKEGVVLFERR